MMKDMYRVCVCALLVALFSNANEADWQQLGQNAQHTFSSDISVPDNLDIVWQYNLDEGEYPHRKLFCDYSSPAVFKDRVYVLTFDHLYCLDLTTGKHLFEVPAYSVYPYTPAVTDRKVYLAAESDLFQCLDAYTGDTIWEKELPSLFMVSPLISEDTVYVTADHSSFFHIDTSPCGWLLTEWSTLLALDKETGEEIWHCSLTDSSIMRGVGFPIYADGSIFFYANYYTHEKDYDPNLNKSGVFCLDARTGTLKWKRENILPPSSEDSIGDINPFWILYYHNKIYIGLPGNILCMDVDTQELLWDLKDIPGYTLLSVGNGVVIVRSWTHVSCLDAETGEELWRIAVYGFYVPVPVMTKNEVFIASGEDIWRVDIKSGEVVESYHIGTSVYSPVIADGYILTGAAENQIFCLGKSISYRMWLNAAAIIVIMFIILQVLKRSRSRGSGDQEKNIQ